MVKSYSTGVGFSRVRTLGLPSDCQIEVARKVHVKVGSREWREHTRNWTMRVRGRRPWVHLTVWEPVKVVDSLRRFRVVSRKTRGVVCSLPRAFGKRKAWFTTWLASRHKAFLWTNASAVRYSYGTFRHAVRAEGRYYTSRTRDWEVMPLLELGLSDVDWGGVSHFVHTFRYIFVIIFFPMFLFGGLWLSFGLVSLLR